MEWIRVRIDGAGGVAVDKAQMNTLYASGLDFEPDERRLRIFIEFVKLLLFEFTFVS